MECLKWRLHKPEFEIFPNKTAFSTIHNISYNFDEYKTNKNTSIIVVCIPETLLPPNFDLDALFVLNWTLTTLAVAIILCVSYATPNVVYKSKTLNCHLISLIPCNLFLIFQQVGLIPQSTLGMWVFVVQLGFELHSMCWLDLFGVLLTIKFYFMNTGPLIYDDSSWKQIGFYFIGITAVTVLFAVGLVFCDQSIFNAEVFETRSIVTKNNVLMLMIVFGIVIHIHLVTFAAVLIIFCKLGKAVRNVNRKMQRNLLKLYVSLVVVLGISFDLQAYPTAVMRDLKANTFFFSLASLPNTLHGVLLLLIFLCKTSSRKYIINSVISRIKP